MWKFLGDALMSRLKSDYEEENGQQHVYSNMIKEAEKAIIEERITGHEAAMKIIQAIFKNEKQ